MSKRDGRQSKAFRTFAIKHWPYCQWCNKPLSLPTATTDHVVPLSRNGTNRIWNLILACRACNNERGHTLAENLPLGPRWFWPHQFHRRTYFYLPLTKQPQMIRCRSKVSADKLYAAVPLQVGVTIKNRPLKPDGKLVRTHYEPGDYMLIGEPQPNGDPLIFFTTRLAFEQDYDVVH